MPNSPISRSLRQNLSSLASRLARALQSRPDPKLCAAIEPLENRALLSAIAWDAGGDGIHWHDPLNWSSDQLPAADDDVTINLPEADPSIQITADAGDIVINSLTSDESLTLAAGSLSVATTLDISTHTLTLAGGALLNATVNASSGASVIVTGSASAIDSVTLNSSLSLTASSVLTITTGVTLNAAATLAGSSRLNFSGTQTLAGTGSIVLNGDSSGVIAASDDMTLTIGAGISISTGASATGTSYIGHAPTGAAVNTSVINNGTITSEISAANITISADSGTFTNNATLAAASSGIMTVSGVWANNGTISVDSATLNLAGTTSQVGVLSVNSAQINISGAIDNTAGNLTLDTSTSTWTLTGSITHGGITATGPTGLNVSGLLASLDGVTFQGALSVASSARLTVLNGLTLNGAVTLPSSSKMLFSGTQTLSGTGSVTFTGSSAGILASAHDMTLTIGSGITISTGATATFTNYIGYASTLAGNNTSVINNGSITSGVSGATLAISAQTGSFTNNASVLAASSGILDLSGAWANPGTIGADNATINITGILTHTGTFALAKSAINITGTLNHTGSATPIDTSANTWALSTGTLVGARLTGTSGLSITSVSSVLDAVTIDGNLSLAANTRTTIKNGLTLNGVATLGASGRLMFSGTQTLSGTGSVVLNGASAGVITSAADMTLTIGSGVTITTGASATGTVYVGHTSTFGGANTSLINNGTLSASVSGATLSIGANSGTFTNNNAIASAALSTVSLTGNWSNLGSLAADNSTLDFAGNTAKVGTLSLTKATIKISGTIDNTGSEFTFDTDSVAWTLSGGTLLGGTFTITGTQGILFSGNSGTFDGITLKGNLNLASNTINVKNGLTFSDSISLSTFGRLHFFGTQTLGGTGTIWFTGSSGHVVTAGSDMTLTIGAGVAITSTSTATGTNYIGHQSSFGGANTSLINNGAITSTKSTISVSANAGTFTNNASMTAAAGYLNISGIWSSTGSLSVLSASTLSLAGTWTSSGSINVDNGTLNLGGSISTPPAITRNAGTVNLTGTLNNTGSTLALNASTGSWNVDAGTIVGGTVTTADGAQFVFSSTTTNTLDAVTVDGSLDLTKSGARVNIKNGLVLNGTATLGNSARMLFSGTQTLDGTGKVIFTTYGAELGPSVDKTTLTIGAGITLISNSTSISANSIGEGFYTASDTTTINNGTIIADGSAASLDIGTYDGAFINSGTIKAINKGTIEIELLTLNSGTISAQSTGTVEINTFYDSAWSNTGTISATTSGVLTLDSTWTNSGTIHADAGTLNLDGNWKSTGTFDTVKGTVNIIGTLDNTGSTLELNALTGSWTLSTGTILGGTINTAAGYGLRATSSSSNYLDGVTFTGFLDLQASASSITARNGLTLNGTATLGTSAALMFDGTQKFTGTATIAMASNSDLVAITDNMTLTIDAGITITNTGFTGTSYIGSDTFWDPENVSVISYATINSVSSSATISLGGDLATATFTNHGTLTASAASSVTLVGKWTNAGTINVNSGTLNLSGAFTTAGIGTVNRSGGTVNITGTLDNTGSTLAINASTGSLNLAAGTILAGTITTADGNELIASSSSANTLDAVTYDGSLNLKSSSARINVKNGLTLNGTATLGTFGQLTFTGTQTLAGTGTVYFTGFSNSVVGNASGMTLTIGSGITIATASGASSNGTIGYTSSITGASSSLVNYGTIISGISGAAIAIDPNTGTFTNHGVVKAQNSGLLTISYLAANDGSISTLSSGVLTLSGPWTNAGTITVNAGTLNLAGKFLTPDFTLARTAGTVNITGTLDNTGSTLALNASTGTFNLSAGTIIGGNVTTSDGASLTLAASTTSTLDGVSLSGSLNANASSAHLTVKNGLTLDGSMYLGTSNRVLFTGTQTLAGTGTVYFRGASSGLLAATADMTLTIGAGITIKTDATASGTNTIGYLSAYSGAGISVINEGTISSAVSGAILSIATHGAGAITNSGTLSTAASSASLYLSTGTSGSIINSGSISTAASGSALYLTTGTSGSIINNSSISTGASSSTLYLTTGASGSITNNGLISTGAAGSTLHLTSGASGSIINNGEIKALSAGTIALNSSWTNPGTILVDTGTLNLAGTFKSFAGITRTSGSINISGKFDNTDSTLLINQSLGSLTLAGGTILGGIINTSDGAKLIANSNTSNTLDGVTLNGDLDLQTSSSQVTIKNGLTLNGTISIGSFSKLNFAGTQTLTGTGTISFVNLAGHIAPSIPEMTLTIDSGITIQTLPSVYSGTPNSIGYDSSAGAKTTIINNGSIISNYAGLRLAYYSGAFINNGLVKATGTSAVAAYGFTNTGALQIAPTASFSTSSSLLSSATDPTDFYLLGSLTLSGPSTSLAPQLLEVMGADLGLTASGFTDNFSTTSLSLSSGSYTKLVDLSDNASGSGAEAHYTNSLTINSGATLDLNGLHLYTKSAYLAGSVINGTVSIIPSVAAINLDTQISSTLSTYAEIDDWSFTAKAGQTVSVIVPNSTRILAQLLDEAGTVLTSAFNSSSGTTVTLANTTLAADGNYRVRISAPAGQLTLGSYSLTVWDVLPPAVIEPAPIAVNEESYSFVVDIHALFQDNQTPDSSLSYSIDSRDVGVSSSSYISSKNLHIVFTSNFSGSTWIKVRATDPSGLSSIANIPITVYPINDRPSFTAATPPTALEDSGPQTLTNWAKFNPGSPFETDQTVVGYTVFNVSNPSLFSVLPSIDANGTLTYTPAPDAKGTSSFYVTVQDSGGTTNNGIDTSSSSWFTINVGSVNDKPSFKASDPAPTNEDATVWSIYNWATVSYGALDESGSFSRYFSVTDVSDPSLFSTLPAVDYNGTLSYTPAPNQFGTSTFTLKYNDGEGTENGGINWSDEQTFIITVNPVNDAPSASWFTKSTTVTNANAGAPITINNWAVFNPGATNETDQAATYIVAPSGATPTAFAVLPEIDSNGNITFTPALNYQGTAYFTVQVKDSGGTANFGKNTSSAKTAGINIIDRITPTVTGFESLSSPIIGSLGSINVTFSEAINTSSFNWSSVSLTRDAGANLIDLATGAGLSLTLVSGTTYTISGLAGLTSQVGAYTLTLLDQGIFDSHSSVNKLSGPASTTFNIGTAAASAPALTDASEGTAGSGYTNTSTPTLTGTATPGATVTIFEGATARGSATANAAGAYSVLLDALSSGAHTLKAVASSPFNAAPDSATTAITVETAAPTLVSISTFAAPRTLPVLTVGVRLSSAVDLTTLTWQDITLTRNAAENLVTSAVTITPSGYDPNVYTITLPASLVNPIGVYSLTVTGADIQNLAGSSFSNTRSTTWTLIPAVPGAPVLDASSESKVGSGITQFTTPAVKGTGSVGSTVEIFEDALLLGSGIVAADGKYLITLSTLAPGAHILKARASDAGANITGFSAISTITVETATPTIINMSAYPAPRTVSVGSTGIRFSSQINLSTFTAADVVLTRDGVSIPTTGITMVASGTDTKLYTIVIPPALNTASGVYVLQVIGFGIKNLAGKDVGNNFSTTWTLLPQIMSMSAYPAPRSVPVTAPGIRFSNPISLPTFNWQDITLKRNNGENLATSDISIVASGWDPNVYTIIIPASLTNTPGTYTLTVTGSGIQDNEAYTISNTLSTTWTQL